MACTSTDVSDETDLVGQLYLCERRPFVHSFSETTQDTGTSSALTEQKPERRVFNRRLRAI
jgi:hypothetical protein